MKNAGKRVYSSQSAAIFSLLGVNKYVIVNYLHSTCFRENPILKQSLYKGVCEILAGTSGCTAFCCKQGRSMADVTDRNNNLGL